VNDRLEALITIAETMDDQLGDAQVTVQSIAADLQTDASGGEAEDTVDLSHRRLQAVAERLGELAEEMQQDLAQ
jgi:hypothetical protein